MPRGGLASSGDRWPLDSIIAKDIFRNGELIQIAAMKKTADGTDGTIGVVLE